MAARENQGLQIALMIFALLVVLFAITTYIYFKAYDDASTKLAGLQTQANNNLKQAQQTQEEINKLKVLMGFSADDNLATIQEGYKKDMETYATAYPVDEQSYRKLVENQAAEISAINRRESESQQRERDLNDRYVALEAEKSGQVEKYVQQMDTIRADVDSLREGFNTERSQITAKQQELADKLKTDRDEMQQLKAASEEAAKKQTTEVADLHLQLDKQQKRLKQYESESFENADGKIINADQLTGTVWIDLGRADALARQVTFSVYGVDENDAAKAKKKGTIEVMRILGPHLAEARITSDEISDPILPRDKIYSPVWQRGRRESFALAGFIDIDGDGKADNARVRELIRLNGGVIDAEADSDGTVTGRMTINTRFLVLGDQPTVKSSKTDKTSDKVFGGYSAMQKQAQDLGVATINVHQFLDHMGWQPDDQTAMLRQGGRYMGTAEGGRANSSGAKSNPFRQRRPTYIRY